MQKQKVITNIVVDCRMLTNKPAGVSNVLINSLNEISSPVYKYKIVLLSHAEFHPEVNKRIIWRDNISHTIQPFFIFKKIGLLWFIFKLPFILRKLKPDLFWSPAVIVPPFLTQNIALLITVHDMVFKYYPESMSRINRLANILFHNRSILKADYIWAVSQYTKTEVEKFYPKRKCIDIFVGSSHDDKLFYVKKYTHEEKCGLFATLQLKDEKFLLCVGTLEPRKNLSFLLELVPKIHQMKLKLVIVGASGWGNTNIKQIINHIDFPKQSVIFLGYISNEQLIFLYNQAEAFISTSLNEGFGLPQLEAMSCGCPVITSNNSAMGEVVGHYGVTIDGWNHKLWEEGIKSVISNRDHYISLSLLRSSQFKWQNVITEISKYL